MTWWLIGGAALVAYLLYASSSLWIRWLVERRLGGFRQRYNRVDLDLPLKVEERRTVAVIGGGLAGTSSAFALAERGFEVTLLEKTPQLGGKVASWKTTLPDGSVEPVSHGFHAFFKHYYNLNRFLNRVGVSREFEPIGDYMICRPGGDHMRFARMDPVPILNLLSLRREGFWRWRDILLTPARDHMNIYMRYDEGPIFEKLDNEPFDAYAERTHLPPRLRLAFNVFARAFFADESKLSTAEMMKSIHFYYFAHDQGLAYDYPTRDFEPCIWTPIRERLDDLGVDVRLSSPVTQLSREGGEWTVNGTRYDYVVLACDVSGAGPLLKKAGAPVDSRALEPGQRYASVRLWIDRDAHHETPPFVITDRERVLDAVAFVHRMEVEARDYVERKGGAVVEMHCYAVPDDMSDEDLYASLDRELLTFFPELEGFRVRHRSGYVRRDFTAFHAGRGRMRPETDSGLPGLFLAGDWVRLPFPAMLMEAAFTSGVMAANRVLGEEGLREEPIDMVPRKGLFA